MIINFFHNYLYIFVIIWVEAKQVSIICDGKRKLFFIKHPLSYTRSKNSVHCLLGYKATMGWRICIHGEECLNKPFHFPFDIMLICMVSSTILEKKLQTIVKRI